MSEKNEIHIDPQDTNGKKVGMLAAILAVLLSIFTISAHRAHTESIELQNEANNQWAHYQSKRIRDYQLTLNSDLLNIVALSNPKASERIAFYAKKHTDYSKELDHIKNEAKATMIKSNIIQKKALYFDLAEGVLEISLVMSSLYFISRKKLFPLLGSIFGLLGTVAGIVGLMF